MPTRRQDDANGGYDYGTSSDDDSYRRPLEFVSSSNGYSTSTSTADALQLLICSGNLGNAAPDVESLHAWIPTDGKCKNHVLKEPVTYPIKRHEDGFEETTFDINDYTDNDQFDIIVIGMQEATFDAAPAQCATNSLAPDSLRSSSISSTLTSQQFAAGQPPGSAAFGVTSSHSQNNNPATNLLNTMKNSLRSRTSSAGTGSEAMLLDASGASASSSEFAGPKSYVPLPPEADEKIGTPPQSPARKILKEPASLQLDGSLTNSPSKASNKSANSSGSRSESLNLQRLQIPVLQPLVEKAMDVGLTTVDKTYATTKKTMMTLAANRDHTKSATFMMSSELSISDVHNLTGEGWRDGGTEYLHRLFQARLPSYQLVTSFQRGEMRLLVFVLDNSKKAEQQCSSFRLSASIHDDDDTTEHAWANHKKKKRRLLKVEVVHVAAQNTGMGGLAANKGGIVAELLVNRTTRLSVCTCHLEAHEGKSKYWARCNTLSDILAGTRRSRLLHDVAVYSHFMFVLGDLNFRTELPCEEYESEEQHRQILRDLVAAKDWDRLNQHDELHSALKLGHCLAPSFETLQCNFPPTFKMTRQSGYNYIEKRRPSYTDRIVFKSGHELQHCLTPLAYEPIDAFSTSDHKPVRAAFSLRLHPPMPALHEDQAQSSTSAIRDEVPAKKRTKPRKTHAFDLTSYLYGSSSTASTETNRSLASNNSNNNRLHLFVSQMQCTLFPPEQQQQTSIGVVTNAVVNTANTAVASLSDRLSNTPSPFIVLFSNPQAALQQEPTFWNRVTKSLFRNHASKTFHSDGTLSRSAFGFPRSSVQKNTYEPDWGEEGIHTIVKLQGDVDDKPIDLCGSQLSITVMDNKNVTSEVAAVVGTFCFNLDHGIRECNKLRLQKQSEAPQKPKQQPRKNRRASLFETIFQRNNQVEEPPPEPPVSPTKKAMSDDGVMESNSDHGGIKRRKQKKKKKKDKSSATALPDSDGQQPISKYESSDDEGTGSSKSAATSPELRNSRDAVAAGPRSRRRGSIIQFFKNHGGDHDYARNKGGGNQSVYRVDINQPLLKNGRQVGRIQCVIELCWVNPEQSKHLLNRLPSRILQCPSTLSDGEQVEIGAQHRQDLSTKQASMSSLVPLEEEEAEQQQRRAEKRIAI